MHIRFQKRTLANGLDVVVHEEHDLPLVAVNVWYHVGSKNEQPGRTGFAHLFEHLMFEGSAHHDHGFFQPLQAAGAALNGSTNSDRTNYWEVVPANALDLALWMESDRMGYLLPALTREKFDNQRDVVLNERRQNYENRPYGLASIAIGEALYPADHPYHWPTIGRIDDLRQATLDDVHAFFRRYYHPGNASLVLAGDVETERAFDLAARYFGEIPAGPAIARLTASVEPLAGESRIVLEDRVEFPRLCLAWRSPALFEPFDAELDLAADLLANGKTSRLYQLLVVERRLALDVAAYQGSRELTGIFQLAATAAPGRTLAEIDTVVCDELAKVATRGPEPDELARGRAQTEAQFVYRLQTIGGFSGKSDQLNAYNVFFGTPDRFAADLERYRTATASAVGEAVGRYLRPHQRVALSVVPRGRADLALEGSVTAVVS